MSKNDVAFKVTVTDAYADKFEEFMNYLKATAGMGHTFPIVVDAGDTEHEKRFEMDGDGSDHIVSIERVAHD